MVDKASRFSGVVSLDSLRQAHKQNRSLISAQLSDTITLDPEQNIHDVLGIVASVNYDVPVVDNQGNYYGVVSKSRLLHTLDKD